MSNNINPKDYVVLDVETNGTSSINDDLLSISIYKPDDNQIYNRFLPLEYSNLVYTSFINGITEDMLKDKDPLTQDEFNEIIKKFELDKRIILTYGNIDERFIKNYLKRKKIKGFEKLSFYNFKHDIISSSFSEGNITKDNLCIVYGIDNVQKVHSGINDCILEWQLFNKINKKKLIVIGSIVYELNKDYIIPVSYLTTYPNFKYCISNFPKIKYKVEEIKKIRIDSDEIKKFETNISGITIEHLINSLLNVRDLDEETFAFQIENKKKLLKIGELPSHIYSIPIIKNKDGTISAINKKDEEKIKSINKVTQIIKGKITPLIDYIQNDLFKDEEIMSQELVINKKDNVLAKCDLSSKTKILEIKAFEPNFDKIKYQLYYQSNNRDIYVAKVTWNSKLKKGIIFTVNRVYLYDSNTNELDKNGKDVSEKTKVNKGAIQRKIAFSVGKYFNTTGNKWSLGSLKFNEEDSFNYKFVKEYIDENKISIKELAKNMDVSEISIRNWINGKSKPLVWNAIAMCVWLNLDETKVIVKSKDK